jgi:methylthioribose-1-phosphate isomerase
MALAAWQCRGQGRDAQRAFLTEAAEGLSTARPTTAPRMRQTTARALRVALIALEAGEPADAAVLADTVAGLEAKYARYAVTGRYLAGLFPENALVMTQCFGETIVGMMLRACRETGRAARFICPETRPYYQGARLTAACIAEMGFDVTVITDNMPAWAMKTLGVDVFTSAADAICMDGAVVNKVGTLQIALAAHAFGVPYFVTGTPNRAYPRGDAVEIEYRNPEETLGSRGRRTAPVGAKGWYPAFDVTPPTLCAGVVTDRGIFSPYDLNRYFQNAPAAEASP